MVVERVVDEDGAAAEEEDEDEAGEREFKSENLLFRTWCW